MKDLLERWAKLEPDRCSFNSPSRAYEICDSQGGFRRLHPGSRESLKWAWLLSCVIDAIKNRGWDFELALKEGYFHAVVQPRDRAQQYGMSKPDGEAIALLSAYLDALEAPVFAQPPADYSDIF